MKKLCILLLSMLLFLSVALPACGEGLYLTAALAEPMENDLPYEEALAIAREVWQETMGAIDEETNTNEEPVRFAVPNFISVTVNGKAERAWRMTLRLREDLDSQDCAVTILSPSGEVVEVETYYQSARFQELQEAKGDMYFWSLEDLLVYGRLFQQLPWASIWHGLPEEGDMTREEAIAKAREIIAERSDIAAAELDAMTFAIAYWVIDSASLVEEGVYDTNIWAVSCGTGGPDTGEAFHAIYHMNLSSVDGDVFYYYDEVEQGPAFG